MVTVHYGTRETDLSGAAPDGGDLWIPTADLPAATGWERKPEGVCTAERCVPVDDPDLVGELDLGISPTLATLGDNHFYEPIDL